jgi:mono/diheme cytochrome c family protein
MQRGLKLILALSLLSIAPLALLRAPEAGAAQEQADFRRDIEPILRASCAACHGAEKSMAQLRLDDKRSAMKVIVPGSSRASILMRRILGEGDAAQMPLGGEPLKPGQIEMIRRWIDQGAVWPEALGDSERRGNKGTREHWAFNAPSRPPLPEVKNEARVRNPIDRFVLSRLEKDGGDPSPEAARATLLRRLSLDLIGLPPSIEELDKFLNDPSPAAYQKQVDRLLASPHYGERWGRLWLDAARYADSDGYEKDKPRRVWFYRDWVIDAFNNDKPYDRFITEQIAGDLLPGATQDQMVATGFLRHSMINEEGGIDPEQFRMEAMFDRMDAIGKSILGLTIQCAQCHNHKYDPLRQEEYYRMFAFLNNAHEANVAVYMPEEEMKRAEIFRRIREIEAGLQHRTPNWRERMAAWEDAVRDNQPEWTVVQPEVDEISTDGSRYLPQPDGSFIAAGYAPAKHRVKMTMRTGVKNIAAIRLELMNDPNLPLGGPGRSFNGSFALTEFEIEAAPAADPKKISKLKFAGATADFNPPEQELDRRFDDRSGKRRLVGPVDFAIDGKDDTAWSIDAGPGQRNQPRKAVFTLEKPVDFVGGAILTFYLSQKHGGWNNNDQQQNSLGRFRLSITTARGAAADRLPMNVREIISQPRDERSPAQDQAVFAYWRTTVPEFGDANKQIADLWRQHPEGSSQLILKERDRMRETHLLRRGDFLKPDKPVAPGVPAFLHSLPADAPPNRLGFARWLVDRRSPTTARVIVNRIWQSYFGTGLVETSEDFGRQGEAPSYPELLDWLAVELMENGWSLKHIHRLIVSSAVYRQSSNIALQLLERDPQNRLLARGSRLRVDAEIVRDIALRASGLLNPKIGGPSVYPPAPEYLFLPPASYGTKTWREEKGDDRYRRAIYTFRFRSVPFPALQAFDAPAGDVSCVRRARSNTPLQALVTLNETLFIEAARALAIKTIREGGAGDEQRLVFAFRSVLARSPSQQEAAELLALLNRQRERFATGELNPWNLATNDPDKPFPLPAGVRMDEVAAWTAVSRVLLNLDEAITKE